MKIEARHIAENETGVFASHSISSGEIIGTCEGEIADRISRHSLTLDGVTIEPAEPFRYLNHSCSSNAFFFHRQLMAARDIHIGEEITIDYLATEKEISSGFLCRCGSKNCRGWMGRRMSDL